MGEGTPAAIAASRYGASLTTRQFLVVLLALALGTILEWYDFFVYSMLNATLSKVFFPSNSDNPTVQQISFWGVFFVGFVARPVGSVIFGHIGDTRGRRLTLLLSILVMAVPTVLIGCLPTYAQAGVAAPVLLALLRLVQGLAMGGEFGSALVYLHEIASKRHKGFTGSIGFASAISGCMLGVLAVLVLEVALTPAQMLTFGWRLPFLASVVSASAALALRLHMPEPTEFLQEKQLLEETHNLAAVTLSPRGAAGHHAHLPQHHHQQHQQQQHQQQQHQRQQQQRDMGSSDACLGDKSVDVECGGRLSPSKDCQDPQHGAYSAAAAAAAAAVDSKLLGSFEQQEQQQRCEAGRSPGCWSGVPFVMLMRRHWAGVALQFLFEAWVSCSFYTLTTWLPLHMHTLLGLPLATTRGMLIVNLALCVALQLASGAASDRGLPRLVSAMSVYVIAGAIIGPVLLYGMRPGGLAAAWVLHALLLALVGWVLGIIPASCSPIYPASVRTTGFNLAHNMSMSWLGGLSPTIVTALSAVLANKFMAPTVLLVAAAGVSLAAGAVLMVYAPAANKAPATDATVILGEAESA